MWKLTIQSIRDSRADPNAHLFPPARAQPTFLESSSATALAQSLSETAGAWRTRDDDGTR
uniref:Uncharacterized protein n=1 Tax=Oryza punctata TaxID=4537 RepID=A0A0E0KTR3_ORYPU